MSRSSGIVAIITGAGSGLGQATAIRMAGKGANIVVVDINEKGGNETVAQVEKQGVDSIFVKADVSNPKDVKNYVDQTVEKFGSIDYLSPRRYEYPHLYRWGKREPSSEINANKVQLELKLHLNQVILYLIMQVFPEAANSS